MSSTMPYQDRRLARDIRMLELGLRVGGLKRDEGS